MGLAVVVFPEIADRRLANALTGGHEAATPVRLALRLRLQSRIENRLDALRSIGRFAAAPGSDFPHAFQPFFREALPPQADCLAVDLQSGRNACLGFSAGRGQHDPASQRDLLRRTHGCQPLFDLNLLILRKRQYNRRTRHAPLFGICGYMSSYLLDTTLAVSQPDVCEKIAGCTQVPALVAQ